jgi:hypothetical protein
LTGEKRKTKNETSVENSETSPTHTPFSYHTLLSALKNEGVILASMKSASFTQDDHHLTLDLSSKWHHEKLTVTKNTNILIEKLNQLFGGEWTVDIRLSTNPKTALTDDVF